MAGDESLAGEPSVVLTALPSPHIAIAFGRAFSDAHLLNIYRVLLAIIQLRDLSESGSAQRNVCH